MARSCDFCPEPAAFQKAFGEGVRILCVRCADVMQSEGALTKLRSPGEQPGSRPIEIADTDSGRIRRMLPPSQPNPSPTSTQRLKSKRRQAVAERLKEARRIFDETSNRTDPDDDA